LLYGQPPKVIWIRLGNCTTSVVTLLRVRHDDVLAFDADPAASFLVLS
jgi:predicted nuclease of predicted toxin-antitoxin system